MTKQEICLNLMGKWRQNFEVQKAAFHLLDSAGAWPQLELDFQ